MKIINNSNNRGVQIKLFGLTIILLIGLFPLTMVRPIEPPNEENALLEVPRLMHQDYSGRELSDYQIPSFLLEQLEGEDAMTLAAYEKYFQQLSKTDKELLESYEESILRLQDPEFSTIQAFDYLTSVWNPEEIVTSIDSLPSFQESFESLYFNDWLETPADRMYSNSPTENFTLLEEDPMAVVSVKEYIDGNQSILEKTVVTLNHEISERVIVTDEVEIYDRTTLTGRPSVELITPDLPNFDAISIPIVSAAGMGAQEIQIRTFSEIIYIGFNYSLPTFDYELDLTFLGIAHFRAWAFFEAGIRLLFPVNVTFEYPSAILEGETYKLDCKLIPMDLPDFNETEIKFTLQIGASLDVLVPKWTTKTVYIWIWWWKWRRVPIKIPWLTFDWMNIFYYPLVDYSFYWGRTYQTPLLGETARIDLGVDFDLLPILSEVIPDPIGTILDVVNQFMEMGLGLGYITVYGDSITAKLQAASGTGVFSQLDAGWTFSEEIESLEFGAPPAEEKFVCLSVSEFVFHSSKLSWTPEFYIRGKNLWLGPIPILLLDWFGELRIPIYEFDLGAFHLPSEYSFSPPTYSIASSDMYDFQMVVQEENPDQGQGTMSTLGPLDHIYNVTLVNLAGFNDIIDLEIDGLPEGYSVTYEGGSSEFLIGKSPKTIDFVVSPSRHISVPPGTLEFNVTATSRNKVSLSVENTSITKTATLDIPGLVDFSLSLENNIHETYEIVSGDYFQFGFYGGNLGNINDTIVVDITLSSTEGTIRSWTANYEVDPYGSGTGSYYNGEFGFLYAREDLFPDSGVYELDVTATSDRLPALTKSKHIFLNFTSCYDLETEVTPSDTTMFANWETNFTFSVTNTGNTRDNFTLVSEGWDDYLSYPTQIINLDPMETENVTLTLQIPNPEEVPSKTYAFRMLAFSDGSASASVFSAENIDVTVLPVDFVAPGIDYLANYESPSGLVFPQSTLILGLSWRVYDVNPFSYTIYIDDIVYIAPSSWIDGSTIFVPVTGSNPLAIGDHNITLAVSDTTGNWAFDEVWVTIVSPDIALPDIIPVPTTLTLPFNFDKQHVISWNCTEENLLNVTIYRDGIEVSMDNLIIEKEIYETSTFRVHYQLDPMVLPVGFWNYTVLIQDMGGNLETSSIFVTIVSADLASPVITSTPVSVYYLARNGVLSLTSTDSYPARYELWLNSTLHKNGTWQSGVSIDIDVDDLSLSVGTYHIQFYVYDKSGNYGLYDDWFNYQDIDPPTAVSIPPALIINEHELSNLLGPEWQLHDFDYRPGTYRIMLDSNLYAEGIWTVGSPNVRVPLIGLTAGFYRFDAYFEDISGNTLISSVDVTVEDVLAPYVWPRDPILFEPIYTASWFEFFVTDAHLDTYQLFRNSVLITEGDIISNFPFLLVDLSDLPTGNYEYVLEVTDESNNVGKEKVLITIEDSYPPFIKRPQDLIISEGTTGHTIIWSILEAHPKNYSLYRNGVLIDSGTTLTESLTVGIDGLGLGTYEYTLMVTDVFGFSHTTSCYVVVVDITAPLLWYRGDLRYEIGDSNAEMVWEAYDVHPSHYRITVNGDSNPSQTWNEVEIVIQLSTWENVGTYEVLLEVTDESGNIASDLVVITIVEEGGLHTTNPPSVTSISGITTLIMLGLFAFLRLRRGTIKKKKK